MSKSLDRFQQIQRLQEDILLQIRLVRSSIEYITFTAVTFNLIGSIPILLRGDKGNLQKLKFERFNLRPLSKAEVQMFKNMSKHQY